MDFHVYILLQKKKRRSWVGQSTSADARRAGIARGRDGQRLPLSSYPLNLRFPMQGRRPTSCLRPPPSRTSLRGARLYPGTGSHALWPSRHSRHRTAAVSRPSSLRSSSFSRFLPFFFFCLTSLAHRPCLGPFRVPTQLTTESAKYQVQ